MSLGNITLSWAGINLVLNSVFEAISVAGDQLAKKELPRSFEGKLEYLKRIEKDPRCAPEVAAEVRAVRLKLAEYNEFRKGLVHGLLFRRGYGPHWRIHWAKEDKDRLLRWNTDHTAEEIQDFAKALSDMGSRLSRLFPPPPPPLTKS